VTAYEIIKKLNHRFNIIMLDLYEGSVKRSCCTNWVEEYPVDFAESFAAAGETRRYTIVVRHA
jgi:hypothetical protein